MFVILHTRCLTKFHFDSTLGFKRNKHKCNLHYVAMPMITSQVSKFVHFTKIQKSGYLKNETQFFLQIKKFINYTSKATLTTSKFSDPGQSNTVKPEPLIS